MSDMVIEYEQRRFNVDEYHRMADAGIFDDERVELLDGLVITMPPIGIDHWQIHARITAHLNERLKDRAFVVPGGSFPLGGRDEPQPDIALLPAEWRSLKRDLPRPSDVLGFIEVSDSSIQKDAGIKLRLYARSRISDYVIVDVRENVVLHHTEPNDLAYSSIRRLGYGETFRLSHMADVVLDVDEFLAPR